MTCSKTKTAFYKLRAATLYKASPLTRTYDNGEYFLPGCCYNEKTLFVIENHNMLCVYKTLTDTVTHNCGYEYIYQEFITIIIRYNVYKLLALSLRV